MDNALIVWFWLCFVYLSEFKQFANIIFSPFYLQAPSVAICKVNFALRCYCTSRLRKMRWRGGRAPVWRVSDVLFCCAMLCLWCLCCRVMLLCVVIVCDFCEAICQIKDWVISYTQTQYHYMRFVSLKIQFFDLAGFFISLLSLQSKEPENAAWFQN